MDKHTELKRGDNDKTNTWGGSKLKAAPSYTVAQLQADLKSVGAATAEPDGSFGSGTEKALKIFQWVCSNLDSCIKNGARTSRVKTSAITVSGTLEEATYVELQAWVKDKIIVSGDLVRVNLDSFSNIEAGAGFKKIGSAKVFSGEAVISKSVLGLLKTLNEQAKKKSVTIKINQAFRVHGVQVTGAVVTPANKSQHLIGHAIDCNIVDGSSWNSSANFKQKKETQNAKDIIASLKKAGYRWGGDFTKVDTPHFDKKLDATSFAYDAKFYLNQRSVTEGHDIPKGQII